MSSEFEGDSAGKETGEISVARLSGRLRAGLLACWNTLFDHYRPELHYMRGRQPCSAALPAKTAIGARR